jgi:DNA anti-recombination protein RmuC
MLERIEDFPQRVEATYEAETREGLSLKEQIKLVTETSQAIGAKADGLAHALRGDSQLLGGGERSRSNASSRRRV